jgi:AcrR family transcriptional regulator
MYQMVQWRMVAMQPRNRLLDATVEHALDKGIVDLSLREIASAIGTSHRMLIYHFGSREGLLVAIVREVERREHEMIPWESFTPDDVRREWDRLIDPSLRSQERLFFEIYVHALLGRPGTDGFLEEALEGWISPIVDSLTRSGVERDEAQVVARLGVAVTRGLLLDLLASGDSAGVTRAYELFASLLQRASLGS